MRKLTPSRRMIALAAAYLVALQALLLPLSVAAGSPFVGSLCSSSTSQPVNHPSNHETGCPCAAGCGMQCCVHALTAPAPVLSALVPLIAFVISAPLAPPVVVSAAIRSPLNARAPPAA